VTTRSVALIISPSREEAISAAHELAPLLISAGISLFTISDVEVPGIAKVAHDQLPDIEAAVVLGGELQLSWVEMELSCELQKLLSRATYLCLESIWAMLDLWQK